MTPNTRILKRYGLMSGSALAAAALPLLTAGGASASQIPGDNGDVKVHSVDTPVTDQRDESHVCHFYLDAFNFDTLQKVDWDIVDWAGTGDKSTVALDGSITLTDGTGHTGQLDLAQGHYKLEWTFAGEHGQAKHKAFWVECETPPPPPPSSQPSTPPSSPSSEPTSEPSSAPSSEPSSAPSTPPSSPSSSNPTSSPTSAPTSNPSSNPTTSAAATTTTSDSGTLAHTGAGDVLELLAAALVVLGAGVGVRQVAATRGRHLF